MSVAAAWQAFDDACTVLLSERRDVEDRIGTEFRALREAIAHALSHAGANDVVLIAGKGHETDQDIAGVKHPFCDVDEARAALAERAAAEVFA